MDRTPLALIACASALAVGSASGAVVTPGALQGWGAYTYGSSTPAPFTGITGTYAHLGNGSAEIRLADEGATEALWWYEFGTPPALSSLNQLSFDWYVSSTSTTPDFTTPAFGLYVTGGTNDGYLIWEGAYNGTSPGGAAQDAWVSSDILNDRFWWNGPGTGSCANAATYQTLAWFNANCLGGTANVLGLAPFLGFGYAGTQFSGAFDNVAYGFANGPSDRFNFEVSADVPEPASVALVIAALGALTAVRRKKPM